MYNQEKITTIITHGQSANWSKSKIARELNKEGYTTARGNKWKSSNVFSFIQRKFTAAKTTTFNNDFTWKSELISEILHSNISQQSKQYVTRMLIG